MGRKIRTRPVGCFVKTLDWSGLSSRKLSIQLRWDCITMGKLSGSEADRIRFWVAREVALATGNRPEHLMQWLLARPNEPMPVWAEIHALQVMKGTRVTKEGTDTAKIGDLLAGRWREVQ
jgi:hypothetical protein